MRLRRFNLLIPPVIFNTVLNLPDYFYPENPFIRVIRVKMGKQKFNIR
jgi:hypothetical protein